MSGVGEKTDEMNAGACRFMCGPEVINEPRVGDRQQIACPTYWAHRGDADGDGVGG